MKVAVASNAPLLVPEAADVRAGVGGRFVEAYSSDDANDVWLESDTELDGTAVVAIDLPRYGCRVKMLHGAVG